MGTNPTLAGVQRANAAALLRRELGTDRVDLTQCELQLGQRKKHHDTGRLCLFIYGLKVVQGCETHLLNN